MRLRPLKPKGTDTALALATVLSSFAWLAWLAFHTGELYGGADEIVHYWMARYSWDHPHLFLDLWGKPLFTTLASPFAQFGFDATRLFNVVIALLTAWFSFRILQILKVAKAWAVIPLLLYAPVYFISTPAVLTEPLFGLVLVLFIHLFLSGRTDLAAILVSFLPFARNEGIFLLPVIAIMFLFMRYYRGVFLLASGIVAMTLVGWAVNGDVLWLLHQNPYTGSQAYGSGDFWHFVGATKHTTGLITAVLAAAGWIWLTSLHFWGRRPCDKSCTVFLYLSSALFLVYFAAHSYAWYKGYNSIGLIRVIAAVVPLASLSAAWTLGKLAGLLKKDWMGHAALAIFVIPVIIYPHRVFKPPREASDLEELGRTAAEWVRTEYDDSTRVMCFDPRILFHLDRDPYNTERTRQHMHWDSLPSKQLRPGELVIWDAHFGEAEAGYARQQFDGDPLLRKVATFEPEDTVLVMGDHVYGIGVYERLP